jgi:hypothetical protein
MLPASEPVNASIFLRLCSRVHPHPHHLQALQVLLRPIHQVDRVYLVLVLVPEIIERRG